MIIIKGPIILKLKSIIHNVIESVGYVGDKDANWLHNKWMQPSSAEGVKDEAWLGGQNDPLGTVQEIEIWPDYQLLYTQTRIHSEEWDA